MKPLSNLIWEINGAFDGGGTENNCDGVDVFCGSNPPPPPPPPQNISRCAGGGGSLELTCPEFTINGAGTQLI